MDVGHSQKGARFRRNYRDAIDDDRIVDVRGVLAMRVGFLRIDAIDSANSDLGTSRKRDGLLFGQRACREQRKLPEDEQRNIFHERPPCYGTTVQWTTQRFCGPEPLFLTISFCVCPSAGI